MERHGVTHPTNKTDKDTCEAMKVVANNIMHDVSKNACNFRQTLVFLLRDSWADIDIMRHNSNILKGHYKNTIIPFE